MLSAVPSVRDIMGGQGVVNALVVGERSLKVWSGKFTSAIAVKTFAS